VSALFPPSLPPTIAFTLIAGRIEIRIFLLLYLLTLPLQLLTTGSLLQQGTKALVVLTSIHAGLVAAMFWGLLANALVATQVVEDGTLSSLIVRPLSLLSLRSFGAGLMRERTAVLFLHARILRSDAVHLARHRTAHHQRIRPV
jgi:hypothetical protein